MSLIITKIDRQPNHRTAIRGDGRRLEQSTRMSSGTFETPYGEMEWDKYFTSNHTMKRREDFVVIRSHEVPDLNETFARISRAANLGKRVVRHCNAVLGARLNTELVAANQDSSCGVNSSTDMQFDIELPITVGDLAELSELDVNEDGEGLHWLRISSRYFDLYADNPSITERPTIGVFIPTEAPDSASAEPKHIRWEYADALLTPTAIDLPGPLGDMSIRAALLGLKPGTISI